MAGFDAVFTMGAVSEMAQPDLSGKSHIFFKPIAVQEGFLSSEFFRLSVLFGNFSENRIYSLRLDRPITADVAGSWFSSNLNIGHPCPILSAVDLLLHQHIQFVSGIHGGPIFINIILEGFAEPDHGNPAFVFYLITH